MIFTIFKQKSLRKLVTEEIVSFIIYTTTITSTWILRVIKYLYAFQGGNLSVLRTLIFFCFLLFFETFETHKILKYNSIHTLSMAHSSLEFVPSNHVPYTIILTILTPIYHSNIHDRFPTPGTKGFAHHYNYKSRRPTALAHHLASHTTSTFQHLLFPMHWLPN